MITASARAGFERLLVSALQGGLSCAGLERVETLPVGEGDRVAVLTVSTYLFRALFMLHFRQDEATRAWFGRHAEEGAPALTDEELRDRVAEAGNVCCGAFNRDLGAHFPHVGMSTPHLIDRECLAYLGALDCGLTMHYRISLEGGPAMFATLCVADHGQVDFHVDPAPEAAEETGELELF